jgi:hypothetical protein
MADPVYARTLQRAAQLLGGPERLINYLGVDAPTLENWLAGSSTPPIQVFLRVVDVIAAESLPSTRPGNASRIERERAANVRQSILARGLNGSAPAPRARTALDYLQARFEPREGADMIQAAIDAAIGATGAVKGNVQLREPDGLHVVSHRGFERPFLDFFACVSSAHCACGVALMTGRRVVVPDVTSDPLFAGTPAGEVLLAAGAMAVQSTPLIGGEGELIGVLSTHYPAPHEISVREHDVLDHIARRTAFWLDGRRL